jgi:S-adenosylhomocysteine hydrolase
MIHFFGATKSLDEEVAELMVEGFGGTITKQTSDQDE